MAVIAGPDRIAARILIVTIFSKTWPSNLISLQVRLASLSAP